MKTNIYVVHAKIGKKFKLKYIMCLFSKHNDL